MEKDSHEFLKLQQDYHSRFRNLTQDEMKLRGILIPGYEDANKSIYSSRFGTPQPAPAAPAPSVASGVAQTRGLGAVATSGNPAAATPSASDQSQADAFTYGIIQRNNDLTRASRRIRGIPGQPSPAQLDLRRENQAAASEAMRAMMRSLGRRNQNTFGRNGAEQALYRNYYSM